jgi:hypothetical protein
MARAAKDGRIINMGLHKMRYFRMPPSATSGNKSNEEKLKDVVKNNPIRNARQFRVPGQVA